MTYTVTYVTKSNREMAYDHLTLADAIRHAEKVARTKWTEAMVRSESGRVVSRRTPLPRGMVAIRSAAAA